MNPNLSIYDNLGVPRVYVRSSKLLSESAKMSAFAIVSGRYYAGDGEAIYVLEPVFGGPALFSEAFGHPMMRARHMKFPITDRHAEEWLGMAGALIEIGVEDELRDFVRVCPAPTIS